MKRFQLVLSFLGLLTLAGCGNSRINFVDGVVPVEVQKQIGPVLGTYNGSFEQKPFIFTLVVDTLNRGQLAADPSTPMLLPECQTSVGAIEWAQVEKKSGVLSFSFQPNLCQLEIKGRSVEVFGNFASSSSKLNLRIFKNWHYERKTNISPWPAHPPIGFPGSGAGVPRFPEDVFQRVDEYLEGVFKRVK